MKPFALKPVTSGDIEARLSSCLEQDVMNFKNAVSI